MPFMGAGAGFQPAQYMKYMQYYQLILQYSSAQAGYSHTFLLQQYNEKGEEAVLENANASFAMWASYLLQSSQVDYMLAIYGMYSGQPTPQVAANAASQ